MKTFTSLRKSLFFALFLISTFTVKADWGDPPAIPLTNWSNSMGLDFSGNVCVLLAPDNMIYIKLKIKVGVDDITPFPAIHVDYNFGDVVSGITPAITNADLNSVFIDNIEYFEAEFEFAVDYMDKCDLNPNIPLPILLDFNYSLVTPEFNGVNYITYPIANYLDCWPPDMFLENFDRNNLLPPVYSGSKDICCSYAKAAMEVNMDGVELTAGTSVTPATEENGSENLDLPTVEVPMATQSANKAMTVFPNPVLDEVQLKCFLPESGNVAVQLLDHQGRLLIEQQHGVIDAGEQLFKVNTADLPPGIYYLHLRTATTNEVGKIIKLNE